MVGKNLPDGLRRRGAEILHAFDALALRPEGIVWLLGGPSDAWRLYVVTSLVDSIGRRETYRLVSEAFDASPTLEELDADDVRVASPGDDPFRTLPRSTEDDARHLLDVLSGGEVYEAYIYRMRPEARERSEDVIQRFRDHVRVARDADVTIELAPMSGNEDGSDGAAASTLPITGEGDSSRGVFDDVVPVPNDIREVMDRNLRLLAA